MQKTHIIPRYPHMLHGGDYNPDQWTAYPHVLEEEMRLFKLANCNEMTLGVFAWAALEPEEGKFDFSFMDKAMDDIYAAGGRVILATPSGARPAWLSKKYPEVLRYTNTFQQCHHGCRHNHCYTSPVYREKVRIINEKLAQRYHDHPALIAWHISNEYGGACYCPQCQNAFRDFLKERYGTLDKLNAAWWTAFWAHTYTDWEQIEPPSPIGEMSMHGIKLDWHRFVSHQTTDFMNAEIAAVRTFDPHTPVTTNLMSFFSDIDYRELTEKLDFASVDVYPSYRGNSSTDTAIAAHYALEYDLTRGFLHKPFILMECTPSLTNWQPINKLKRPGMHTLSCLQAIAHGSDSALYFQFRKSRGSSEKFHGAVIDHCGHENTRVFREVSALGQRLKGLDDLVGTQVDSKIAILFDWSNWWALADAEGFQKDDKKLLPTLERYYTPLWERGINTDIIGFKDDFSKYKAIIAPMLYAISEESGQKLKDFVAEGGILLGTYTTAMVDENDLCHLGGLPGAGLREVFGIWNEEIDTLYPEEKNSVKLGDGTVVDAVDYCEVIHPEGAEVIARYDSDFYAGMSAATVNHFGNGHAYYVTFRDTGDFAPVILDEILQKAAITSDFDGTLPQGVSAHSRTDAERTFVFLQNFNYETQCVQIPTSWKNFETGEIYKEHITLDPLQTLILVK
jgi:beta-galactosidase